MLPNGKVRRLILSSENLTHVGFLRIYSGRSGAGRSVVIWEYGGEGVFEAGCIVMVARLGAGLQDQVDYTRHPFCPGTIGVRPAFIMGTDQPPYPPINRCKGHS